MVAEERLDHHALVGVEALLEARATASPTGCCAGRGSGEKVSAGEPSRSPGIRKRPGATLDRPDAARGGEIAGEGRRKRARRRLVERRRRVGRLERREPGARRASARPGRAGGGDRGRRPVGEALRHQRQVEQPFAGVVGDVEMHGLRPGKARDQARGAQPQRQPQGRDRAGALGPARLGREQRREMLLEGEARHGVVGLRLQVGREDAALGGGAQLRHPAALEQVRDQRGDEHGLAGAAEAGDAEPDHRVEQALAESPGPCPRSGGSGCR